MDARLTEEQRSIKDTAARIVRKNAVTAVSEIGDERRALELGRDLDSAGFRGLRDADAGATGLEVALIAEQLAMGVVKTAFLGPILAAELCRRAGVPTAAKCTVALSRDLARVAGRDELADAVAFDAARCDRALVLTGAGDTFGLALAPVADAFLSLDLSRPLARLAAADLEELPDASLSAADLTAWRSFGHAVSSADLLGAARAAHNATVRYATERTQYGRSVASFQAVAHLLAESLVALEGAESAVNYAAWAVDALALGEAVDIALVARLYCGRAAKSVCETAIQVHGGIGNTWECMAHVYLRRVLMTGQVLGDEDVLMSELVARRSQVA